MSVFEGCLSLSWCLSLREGCLSLMGGEWVCVQSSAYLYRWSWFPCTTKSLSLTSSAGWQTLPWCSFQWNCTTWWEWRWHGRWSVSKYFSCYYSFSLTHVYINGTLYTLTCCITCHIRFFLYLFVAAVGTLLVMGAYYGLSSIKVRMEVSTTTSIVAAMI